MGIIWESFGDHLGMIWRSFGDHLGIIWGSFEGLSQTREGDLPPNWGSFGDHLGVIWGAILGDAREARSRWSQGQRWRVTWMRRLWGQSRAHRGPSPFWLAPHRALYPRGIAASQKAPKKAATAFAAAPGALIASMKHCALPASCSLPEGTYSKGI